MSATDFTPQPPGAGVNQSFRSGRTILALMLREMSTRYGRSPGGYIWAILEPIGGIIILALGFSLLLKNPPLGNNFILFYATGFVPFLTYQNISNTVARALTFSKPLLQYPAVSWADAVIARFVLNALTSILVGYIVLFLILMSTETRAMLNIIPIAKALGLLLLIGLAIGMLNCALSGLIDTWDMIWSVLTRPLFLASGVILLFEGLPPGVQDILWYNPLFHIVGLARAGFYPTYEAAYVSELYVVSFSLVTLFMGTVLLRRYHRDILTR